MPTGPTRSEELLSFSRGAHPAPLVLKNARIINVFTGEVDPAADIAIADGLIVGVGRYRGGEEVDLAGRPVCPGLIDGHVHLESSMVTPGEFARAVVPRGTTAVVADPHEIANVAGAAGIHYILRESEGLPLTVFIGLPSCVPATPFEDSGAVLRAEDLADLVGEPRVVALGEVMDVPAVLRADRGLAAKLELFRRAGLVIDGHSPGLTGQDLSAYILAGVGSDHECTTAKEAEERLALGMRLMIREGSAARDLDALLPAVTLANSRRCLLVTDDRNPSDLLGEGHLDHLIRKAMAGGLDLVTAIRMATLNVAEYFGLDRVRRAAPDHSSAPRGALAPGFTADVVVLRDLEGFEVEEVYAAGKLVARGGQALVAGPGGERPASPADRPAADGRPSLRDTCRVAAISTSDFAVPVAAGSARSPARVIDVTPNSIVTGNARLDLPVRDGCLQPDSPCGVAKLVVVERHRASGRIGVGFVRGLGFSAGALASSVSHDAHNIVAAGFDDGDILSAVRAVVATGGGLAAARDGHVAGQLPLPIAGLLSDRPLVEVAGGLARVADVARLWGAPAGFDPFMPLAFLTLAAVPELKLTDRGLVDVGRGEIVPVAL